MRILLADDHDLVRDGLKPFLQELAVEVEVVEAGDLAAALEVAAATPPDLALLDLMMPGMEGGAGIATFRQQVPDCVVVILSGQYDRNCVMAAVGQGVRGYLPKTLSGTALINALRLVLSGETYLPSSAFADGPDGGDGEPAAPAGPAASAPDPGLSGREAEILRQLVEGGTNKEIARRLDIQEITVKVHLRSVYRKIGVSNRAQAVRIALQAGLV